MLTVEVAKPDAEGTTYKKLGRRGPTADVAGSLNKSEARVGQSRSELCRVEQRRNCQKERYAFQEVS